MAEKTHSSLANGHVDDQPDTLVSLAELLHATDNSKASQSYLNHLTTLSLHTLKTEPTVLQTQAHHLTSSLTSLTHTSHSTFLSLHTTTGALTESLDSLSSSLDSLINDSLPALESSAAGWHEKTHHILAERQQARVVLDQHDKLRDLLDIPILIDTCVRNGYFAEALSLAAHTKSLSSWSSGTPLIVRSILSEVHNSITQMLLSLLKTLHEPNRKLPALWKAVNFLRKMEAFQTEDVVEAEEQIALSFIAGRESCLKAALESTERDIQRLVGAGSDLAERDKEDIAKYTKRYIDAWREGVFDIITQFTTIFLERPAGSSNETSPTPPPSLRTILSTYASHSLYTHFVPLLSFSLPHIPLPSLPSLLTQVTYCATAFGRVGFDFRGVLDDLFSNAVLTGVSSEIKNATAKWLKILKTNIGSTPDPSTPMTSILRKKPFLAPSKFLLSSSVSAPPLPSSMSTSPSSSTFAQAHIPPQVLAAYTPLAEYTNAILTTFNNLRLLAPISIFQELQSVLDNCLADAGHLLFLYIKKVFDDSKKERQDDQVQEQEEKIAIATGKVYFSVFVPFIRRAMGEGVFGFERDYSVCLKAGEQDDAPKLAVLSREWEAWLESEPQSRHK